MVRSKGFTPGSLHTLDILQFEEQSGGIVANDKVTGKVTGKDVGNKKVSKNVVLPVEVTGEEVTAQAICQVLYVVIGPISLDLVGLHLRTNTIRIRLFATPEGLLSDLLCGLTGPIGIGPLGLIVNILNQILAILQGL